MNKFTLLCFSVLLSNIILANDPRPTSNHLPPSHAESSASCDFVVVPTRIMPLCHGGTDGSISVQILGNGGPFNYVWQNGVANQPLLNIGAGNYSLTVTDQSGCTKVESITLMENPPIQVSLQVKHILCYNFNDGSIGAYVTGGVSNFSYLWSNGATGGIIENLTPGNYSVTVTDGNGCTKTDAADIIEPADIIVTQVSVNGACGGNTGSATVSATGGTPPYNYIWNTGHIGPTLSNAAPGLYYVCVFDVNGCQKDEWVTIDSLGGLSVQIAISSAQCPGVTNGVATAVVGASSGNLVYAWNIPGAPPVSQLNGLAAGQQLSVTVTDIITGCVGSASAVMGAHNQVKVDVNDVDVVCPTDLTGSAIAVANSGIPPYTYEWTLPNGVKVSGNQISGLPAGAYMVSVTDAVGCTAVGVADIAASSKLKADFQLNLAACVSNNDVLVSFSDKSSDPSSTISAWQWNIVWSTGSQQFSLQNPAPIQLPTGEQGTAQLTVTSTAGCTASISQVFTAPKSDLTLIAQTINTDCSNDPIGMAMAIPTGGAAPYQFIWSNAATTQQISGLTAGTYTVTATDSKNCTATATASVKANSNLTPDFSFNIVECLGNQVTVNFADQSTDPNSTIISWNWNITWSGGGQAQFGIQNPGNLTLPDKTTGVVQLTVTSAAGCVETISEPFAVEGVPDVGFNVNLPAVKCGKQPVTIEVSGSHQYTYTWSPTTGLVISNAGQTVLANPNQNTTYFLTVNNKGCEKIVEVPVRVSPEIQLTTTPDLQTCDLVSTLVASSAAPGVTYQWFFNASVIGTLPSLVVNNMGSKTYTVVATDPLGCTESRQVSVVGLGTPVTLANPPSPACENSDIILSLVSADPVALLTYSWSSTPNLLIQPNNASTVTIRGSAGNYVVKATITNQNSCTSEITIPIQYFEGQSLDGKISANLCNGLEVKFTNTSGVPGIWYFGDGSTSAQVNPTHIYGNAANYTVQFVPGTACVSQFDTTISVSATPAIRADFKVELKKCRDEALFEITNLTQHNQPNVLWWWNILPAGLTSNEKNPTFRLLQEGQAIFILKATDANGCVGNDTLTVPFNIIRDNFERNLEFCEGNQVELNTAFGTNYTYAWTANPPDPNLNANSPNPRVQPAQPTTYSVLITWGSCQVRDTVVVTPHPAATLTLPAPKVVCSNAPVQLVAGGNGVSYEWSANEDFKPLLGTGNTLTVVPVRDGNYFVRSTTNKNCSTIGQVFLNNGTIKILGKGNLDKMICLGMSTTLNMQTDALPTDVLTYSWSPLLQAVASPVVNPIATTTYTGFVVNQFGCGDTAQYKVEVVALSATASSEKDTICPGESTLLSVKPSGGKNYQFIWMPENSLDNPRLQNPTASPSANTTYSVTVTDDLGCSATATVSVAFINLQCRPPYIFVPDAFTPNGDNKNDRFMVRTSFAEKLYFAVYNRWGELMFETKDPKDAGWDGTYKGRLLTPDAYGWYLKVNCPNGQEYSAKGNVTLLK